MKITLLKPFTSENITQDMAAELFALVGLQKMWKSPDVRAKGYIIKDEWWGKDINGNGGSFSSKWYDPNYTEDKCIRTHNGVSITLGYELDREGKHMLRIWEDGRAIMYSSHKKGDVKSWSNGEYEYYNKYTSYHEYACSAVKLMQFYLDNGFYTVIKKQYMITPISYNGGTIWVDKEVIVSKGDTLYSSISNKICIEWLDANGNKNSTHLKVVAQSTNLSIPNIPYVEIEEDVESIVREYTDKAKLNGWEQSGFRIGYKAASAKGKYTEEDLENAFNLGLSWDGEDTETNTFNSFIESLQPKIESIEIEVENIWTGLSDFDAPVTYQKDGKILLKIKKVNYDSSN